MKPPNRVLCLSWVVALFATGCSFDPALNDALHPKCIDGDCSNGCVCLGGHCVPPDGADPLQCVACASAADCDDGDGCTLDGCQDRACTHAPLDCDDGDACTQDSCSGGGCVNSLMDCDDEDPCTLDTCDPIDGCLHAGAAGAACDDSDPCTTVDVCQADGSCHGGGQELDCDDSDVCTLDMCVPGSGCTNTHEPHPEWAEVCFDGADDECDGVVDGCCGDTGQLADPLVAVEVSAHPVQVLAADLNEDGRQDLVVVSNPQQDANPGGVAVYTNAGNNADGQVRFDPPEMLDVGQAPVAAAVADLNADDILDLVVAVDDSDEEVGVRVLIGRGQDGRASGEFEAPDDYLACSTPRCLAVGDVDGDGALDLVLGCASGLAVLLGNRSDEVVPPFTSPGDGTFTPADNGAINLAPIEHVATADLDGDGRAEIVELLSDPTRVSVVSYCDDEGNCGGGDNADEHTIPAAALTGLALADLDADGWLDILVTSDDPDRLVILPNLEGEGIGPPVDLPVFAGTQASRPAAPGAVDLNGDGSLDLTLVDASEGKLTTLLADSPSVNSGFTFSPGLTLPAGAGPADTAAADFNGDALVDLALVNQDPGALIFAGDGKGGSTRFDFARTEAPGLPARAGIRVLLADFDRNRATDLLLMSGAGEVHLLWGQASDGRGTLQYPSNQTVQVAPGLSLTDALATDLNGDAQPDLAVAGSHGVEGRVWVLISRKVSDGQYGDPFLDPISVPVQADPVSLVSADLDRDQAPELITANRLDSSLCVVWNRDPDQTGDPFSRVGHWPTVPEPVLVLAGQLNQDGLADLVAVGGGEPVMVGVHKAGWSAAEGRLDYALSSTTTLDAGPARAAALADFDSDGIADLVIATWSDGEAASHLFWLAGEGSNGQGAAMFAPALPVGEVGKGVAALWAQDFDSDGLVDLVVLAAEQGELAWLRAQRDANGGFGFSPAGSLPVPADLTDLAAARLDGDVWTDLALIGPGQARPLLLRGLGGCLP